MKLPRHRYLRAFVEWLDERRDVLPAKLRRVQKRKRSLVYRMDGYPEGLELVVRPGEVLVLVTQDGEVWDMLVCFESNAVRADGGYRCNQCYQDVAERWPTRQALWRCHDFDALARWLWSKLGIASRLELHQMSGMTWVALCTSPMAATTASLKSVWALPEPFENEPPFLNSPRHTYLP